MHVCLHLDGRCNVARCLVFQMLCLSHHDGLRATTKPFLTHFSQVSCYSNKKSSTITYLAECSHGLCDPDILFLLLVTAGQPLPLQDLVKSL